MLDLHQRRIERVPLPGTKCTRCFDDNRKEYVMGTWQQAVLNIKLIIMKFFCLVCYCSWLCVLLKKTLIY